MLVNAAFSFGQFFFEVPTGVVADTLGRRVSLLLCLVTLLGSTLAYVAIAWLGLGFWPFVGVSILLGLGFTFYTGAVDAWMVDALKHLGRQGPLEPIFAKAQVTFGIAMLIGTTAGGLLGQIHLYLPYVLRAVLIVPTIVIALQMKELGWSRPAGFSLAKLPHEMRQVFVDGVRFGFRNPVVRPLMLGSAIASSFMMFGFYSWQRYFLDLLGKELVWVTGLIAALVGLSGIIGNLLTRKISSLLQTRSSVLMATVVIKSVAIVLCGLFSNFYAVVGLYLLQIVAGGVSNPVRQAMLNAHIPSER